MTNVTGNSTGTRDGYRSINTKVTMTHCGWTPQNTWTSGVDEYSSTGKSFNYDVSVGPVWFAESVGAIAEFHFQRGQAPVEVVKIWNFNEHNMFVAPSAQAWINDKWIDPGVNAVDVFRATLGP